MTKTTISAEVPDELSRGLHIAAAIRGWSKSRAIREAVELWLAVQEDKADGSKRDGSAKIAGALADALCDCGYILPSRGNFDPQLHEPSCPYRLKMEALK